jgi:hypothetical protein
MLCSFRDSLRKDAWRRFVRLESRICRHTGSAAAGYAHFSSSDPQSLLPANSTLVGSASNFSATWETAGNRIITATDTVTGSIAGSSGAIAVTAVPALAISSGAPLPGTVGVNYGATTTQYLRCAISPPSGNIVCTPCTPGAGGTCGSYPPCGRRQRTYPCIETISKFPGFIFMASGGVPPYSWAATSLPPPLSLNSQTGEVPGTPTSPGPYTVGVTVIDSGLPKAQFDGNVLFTINKPPTPVVILTPALPTGVVNQPYSYTFSASGYAPLTWTGSGALPSGLSPVTTAGVLAGTPTQSGSISLSVTAIDQFQQSSAAARCTSGGAVACTSQREGDCL